MGSPIVHFEIHAADPDRCIQFYETVFGWSSMVPPGMEGQYWLVFPTGEPPEKVADTGPSKGIGGGVMLRRGEPPEEGQAVNAFTCVVEVEALQAAYDAVKANGGTIALEPMEVPGVGNLFYCKDTEGNILGVLEPAPPS